MTTSHQFHSATEVPTGATLEDIHPAFAEVKHEIKSVKRPAGAIMVHPVESAHMAELAGRAANHQKWDSRLSEYVASDCPRRVADSLLARGHWPQLPDLVGFIETPTITDDGRVIDQPGYDDSSGLFCAFTAISGYKRPPAKPTRKDASAAAERLLRLFESFPFVDVTDRAAMLAALLTAIQRRLLSDTRSSPSALAIDLSSGLTSAR